MARKNGELEATVRKLRTSVRQLETERDRAAGRLAAVEGSLAQEQERAVHTTQAAAAQVCALTLKALEGAGLKMEVKDTQDSSLSTEH